MDTLLSQSAHLTSGNTMLQGKPKCEFHFCQVFVSQKSQPVTPQMIIVYAKQLCKHLVITINKSKKAIQSEKMQSKLQKENPYCKKAI